MKSRLLLLLLALTACGSDQQPTSGAPTRVASTTLATTPAPPRAPTPTYVPTIGSGTSGSAPVLATQPSVSVGGTFRFEDTAWSGGWRNRGTSVYGGRTATWIYGSTTQYNTMQTTFSLDRQPSGTVELRIEGLDSEDAAKTQIRVMVNGQEVFAGPNPLPNDDIPLDSGPWATATFRFPAAALRAGSNTIAIQNRSAGTFGRPPFFMLDYADLVQLP